MVKKILFTILMLFLFASLLGTGSSVSGQSVLNQLVYLPLINREVTPSIFGGEISYRVSNTSTVWSLAQSSGMYWVRKNGLLWSDIQPNNNSEWKWENAAQLETELAQTGSNGSKTVLVIRSTPTWAQKYTGYFSGPMRSDRIADFANFVKETVKRYSAGPYFVQYYEFWNEPDVDHFGLPVDSPFGGWGEPSDPYYGGQYYAQMLSQVYPEVKSVNPNAQVLIGGLLLDCDPTDDSSTTGCITPSKKIPPKFFEGILKNGGGAYFDIVNFHGYPYLQSDSSNPILLEINFLSWKSRGGVVKGKIDYLREIMSKYGVNKPIFQSETALMRSPNHTDIPGFERSKADYLVWVFCRNISENLLGTTWYTFNGPGWNSSGLLDGSQVPLLAYQAYKFAIQELSGAVYSAPLNSYPGIIGFEYKKGTTRIQVLFRINEYNNTPPTLTLPATFKAAYDTLGSAITPVNNKVTIDHPVYVELNP